MSDETQYRHEVFKCSKQFCNFICYTLNQLQEHNLDKHSSMYIPKYTINGFHYALHNDVEKEKKDDTT